MNESSRRRLAAVCYGVGLGSLGVLVAAWVWPTLNSNDMASAIAVPGAIAWAIAAILRVPRQPAHLENRRETLVLGGGGAAICALLIWLFGHRHVGGFDHSALIDLAWRVASGQRPGIDFPNTMPIGFVLAAGYAFKLFGVSWTAIVAWQAAFAALTFLWSYALMVRITDNARRSALLSLAVQAAGNLVTSYWWYNTATTTAGAVFFLSAAAWWREPGTKRLQASYFLSLWILAGLKPNIAGVLIAGVTTTLLFSRAHRGRVIVYSAITLLLFTGWLALEHIWLGDVLRGYLSISSRGFSLQQFLQDLLPEEKTTALLLLSALLLPWLTRLNAWRGDTHGRWLAVTAAAAGAYGFLMNGESKFVDLPLLLLALWWVGICDTRDQTVESGFMRGWKAYVVGLGSLLLVGGLTVGALRQRVRSIGLGTFFEYSVSEKSPTTPFFAGTETGIHFVRVESELLHLLAAQAPRQIFFGPRLQWGYAAFGFPSPAGQPVWWHAGVSYAISDEPTYVARWASEKPDVAVFLHDDFKYLPPEFMEALGRQYELLPGYRQLDVLVRRDRADLPAATVSPQAEGMLTGAPEATKPLPF